MDLYGGMKLTICLPMGIIKYNYSLNHSFTNSYAYYQTDPGSRLT